MADWSSYFSMSRSMRFNYTLPRLVVLFFSVLGHSVVAEPTASEFSRAVVQIESRIFDNGRTVKQLGTQRKGSAIVIDASGLLVTVGYLVLEAQTVTVSFNNGGRSRAEVIANDHRSGLALLRATVPDDIVPIPLGDPGNVGIDEGVVVLKPGGTDNAHVARVADIREFSGSWEYHIEDAFYTVPETRDFSGAALLDRQARLVGIGSLLLGDIYAGVAERPGNRRSASGNLFIPIDYLSANLGSLLTMGAVDLRPWLGLTLNETRPDLTVARVAKQSPADTAGLRADDVLIAINSLRVNTLRDFYKALWSAGDAGVSIDLLIGREGLLRTVSVDTVSRSQWLVD